MLKEEIKKIIYRKEFICVCCVFFVAAILDFLLTCKSYYGIELSWVRSAYKCYVLNNDADLFTNQIFSTLFPLLICVAVSDIFCVEYINGTMNFIISRTSLKRNILNKAIAVCLVSFLISFIPMIVNFMLCIITFPLQGFYCTNASYLTLTTPEKGRVFGYLEMFYPYINCILHIVLRSLIGSTLAFVSFSFSLLKVLNRYCVLFAGMSYYILYSCIVGLPVFSNTPINTSLFYVNGYGSEWMFLFFFGISWIVGLCMLRIGIKRESY